MQVKIKMETADCELGDVVYRQKFEIDDQRVEIVEAMLAALETSDPYLVRVCGETLLLLADHLQKTFIPF